MYMSVLFSTIGIILFFFIYYKIAFQFWQFCTISYYKAISRNEIDLFSMCFIFKAIAIAFYANITFIYLNIMYLLFLFWGGGKSLTNKNKCIVYSAFHLNIYIYLCNANLSKNRKKEYHFLKFLSCLYF